MLLENFSGKSVQSVKSADYAESLSNLIRSVGRSYRACNIIDLFNFGVYSPQVAGGHGACNVQGMRKTQAEHLRDRLAGGVKGHRPPGRPAKASYSPLGEALSLEAGALAREYQSALACHLDAFKAKRLADQRLTTAVRRLAGARRACLFAGLDIASLENDKEKSDHTCSVVSRDQPKSPQEKEPCGTCDGKTFFPGMSWTCPTCQRHYNVPL